MYFATTTGQRPHSDSLKQVLYRLREELKRILTGAIGDARGQAL